MQSTGILADRLIDDCETELRVTFYRVVLLERVKRHWSPWDNPTLLGDLDSSWNHPWSCPMVDSVGTTLLEYLQDLDAPLIEPDAFLAPHVWRR